MADVADQHVVAVADGVVQAGPQAVGPARQDGVAVAAVLHRPREQRGAPGLDGGRHREVADDQVGARLVDLDRAGQQQVVGLAGALEHRIADIGAQQHLVPAQQAGRQLAADRSVVAGIGGQRAVVRESTQRQVAAIDVVVQRQPSLVVPPGLARRRVGGAQVLDPVVHREGGAGPRGVGHMRTHHLEVGRWRQQDLGDARLGPGVVGLEGVLVDMVVDIGGDDEVEAAGQADRQLRRQRAGVALAHAERAAVRHVAEHQVGAVQQGVGGQVDTVVPGRLAGAAVTVVLAMPGDGDRLAGEGLRRRGHLGHLQVRRRRQRDAGDRRCARVVVLLGSGRRAFEQLVVDVGDDDEAVVAVDAARQRKARRVGVGAIDVEVAGVLDHGQLGVGTVQRVVGGQVDHVVPGRHGGGAGADVAHRPADHCGLAGERVLGRRDAGHHEVWQRPLPGGQRLRVDGDVVTLAGRALEQAVAVVGANDDVEAADQVARQGDRLHALE